MVILIKLGNMFRTSHSSLASPRFVGALEHLIMKRCNDLVPSCQVYVDFYAD